MQVKPFDVAIIGAGLIGLSTAMHLGVARRGARVVVLEKDPHPASQQSGHNSGVIHSGIYYRPGSFKGRFSVRGHASIERFCEEHGIPVKRTGKLVVATEQGEIPRLQALFQRAQENGVPGLRLLTREQATEIEPHTRAIEALSVPGTAIVDFTLVAKAMAEIVTASGGALQTGSRVTRILRNPDRYVLETDGGTLEARVLVNCAGLHSDVIARMSGIHPSLRIVPFRGEYYRLTPSGAGLVKGLIYPVPDPAFPFLGVHFTRTIEGSVEAGPNAVLAAKREGYDWLDVSPRDLAEMLTYPGFWRLALREWRVGVREVTRSLSKRAFLRSLQKLVPEIRREDLSPGGSGVRAQAVAPDGTLIDDFRIEETANAVHVLNAPSPGATCSLVIGEHIAAMTWKKLDTL